MSKNPIADRIRQIDHHIPEHTQASLARVRLQRFKTFLLTAALGSLVIIEFLYLCEANNLSLSRIDAWMLPLTLKVTIEIIASIYAVFYLVVALSFVVRRGKIQAAYDSTEPTEATGTPKVAVLYLCCNDLDEKALESILTCDYSGAITLIVHDDSTNLEDIASVDEAVERMKAKYKYEIVLMRRHKKDGGKPGALNNVFVNYVNDFDYFLICDSDSYMIDPGYLKKGLAYFRDPKVALVQFKNVGYTNDQDSRLYRLLSLSVDFYDIFVQFLDRFGWSPFLGHNALVRASAVSAVGGFTPNQFADDIDFSVKLYLSGYRIAYARDIVSGERHPMNYHALRKRTYKWTFGCTQILKRWTLTILKSDVVGINEKITLFLTTCFYHLQILLMVYLIIFYYLMPFRPDILSNWVSLGFAAFVILFLTFLPSFTYFLTQRQAHIWLLIAPLWGIVYGSQDFVYAKAFWDCMLGKKRSWEPTNTASSSLAKPRWVIAALEVTFGLSLLVIPALKYPYLLILPTTILFSGKFFCIPFLYRRYGSTWGHEK